MPVSVPVDIVKKFCPVLVFHPEEKFLPCSIEYLLSRSDLRYRNFGFPNPITGQTSSSTPSITTFNQWLYMVYQDSKGFDIYVTRSQDGLAWQGTTRIPSVRGGSPTIVAFRNRLWLVWHSVLSSQLWIADSADGLKWENIRKIDGQHAWRTALTVFNNELFMVYTDSASSQLWSSRSIDGSKWTGTAHIVGQHSSHVSLTVFGGKIVMVYGHAALDNPKFYISEYDGKGWTPGRVILGSAGTGPSLVTIDGALFLTYNDASEKLYATRSRDGRNWEESQILPGQKGDIPSSCVMNNIIYIVYRQDTHLYSTFCENGDLTSHPVIKNPTMADLAKFNNRSYYVQISPSQYAGEEIPKAPMYYAVQSKGSQIFISYLILYADQGGQTVRALRAGTEFNCIINTIGQHQGDLERFTILLNPPAVKGGEYTIVQCGFEQHGVLWPYEPKNCTFEDGTHAVVHIALNGHSSHNADPANNGGMTLEFAQPGIVGVGSWIGNGKGWRAYSQGSEFKRVGLDENGKPVSDQVWAAFKGRLGDTVLNSLTGGTTFDGKNLDSLDWLFVQSVFGIGNDIGVIPQNLLVGDAPTGPGVRDWVVSDVQVTEITQHSALKTKGT